MTFFEAAFSRYVVINAFKVALIVGSILAIINHGSAIASGDLSSGAIVKILLTYLVPYCVSTYSAVKAIQKSD